MKNNSIEPNLDPPWWFWVILFLCVAAVIASVTGCQHPPPPPIIQKRSSILLLPTNNNWQLASPRSNAVPTRPLVYRWSWVPEGCPVWFEVYRSTNLSLYKFTGGTNIPGGFEHWTNVNGFEVLLDTTNYPIGFLIVRAANSAGVTEWAQLPQ